MLNSMTTSCPNNNKHKIEDLMCFCERIEHVSTKSLFTLPPTDSHTNHCLIIASDGRLFHLSVEKEIKSTLIDLSHILGPQSTFEIVAADLMLALDDVIRLCLLVSFPCTLQSFDGAKQVNLHIFRFLTQPKPQIQSCQLPILVAQNSAPSFCSFMKNGVLLIYDAIVGKFMSYSESEDNSEFQQTNPYDDFSTLKDFRRCEDETLLHVMFEETNNRYITAFGWSQGTVQILVHDRNTRDNILDYQLRRNGVINNVSLLSTTNDLCSILIGSSFAPPIKFEVPLKCGENQLGSHEYFSANRKRALVLKVDVDLENEIMFVNKDDGVVTSINLRASETNNNDVIFPVYPLRTVVIDDFIITLTKSCIYVYKKSCILV